MQWVRAAFVVVGSDKGPWVVGAGANRGVKGQWLQP